MQADRRLIVSLAVFSLLPVPAMAQWQGWDYDFDRARKPWTEIQAKIPPYPKTENLIRFTAGAASPHRFYIDAKSVSVGEDGVVRYTLLIRTSGGATNVTFEGMRCDTRDVKIYAIGHASGGWTRSRDPKWRHIEYKEINRHHAVLYSDYFCPDKIPVTSAKVAIDLLMQDRPLER